MTTTKFSTPYVRIIAEDNDATYRVSSINFNNGHVSVIMNTRRVQFKHEEVEFVEPPEGDNLKSIQFRRSRSRNVYEMSIPEALRTVTEILTAADNGEEVSPSKQKLAAEVKERLLREIAETVETHPEAVFSYLTHGTPTQSVIRGLFKARPDYSVLNNARVAFDISKLDIENFVQPVCAVGSGARSGLINLTSVGSNPPDAFGINMTSTAQRPATLSNTHIDQPTYAQLDKFKAEQFYPAVKREADTAVTNFKFRQLSRLFAVGAAVTAARALFSK